MAVIRDCCVRDCKTCPSRNRTLFAFPKVLREGMGLWDHIKGLKRCLYWMQKSGNDHLLCFHPERVHNTFFMCSEHFGSEQFAGPSRRRLKRNVFPYIFPHDGLPNEKMDEYVNRLKKCSDNNLPCSRKCVLKSERYSAKHCLEMASFCSDGIARNGVPGIHSIYKHNKSKYCYLHHFKNCLEKKRTQTKRVKRKCSIANCTNTNVEAQLFAFPRASAFSYPGAPIDVKKYNRCLEWVKASGNESLFSISPLELWKQAYVCVTHFKEHHFQSKMKRKLLIDAVPTETLPIPISQTKINHYRTFSEEMFGLITKGIHLSSANLQMKTEEASIVDNFQSSGIPFTIM